MCANEVYLYLRIGASCIYRGRSPQPAVVLPDDTEAGTDSVQLRMDFIPSAETELGVAFEPPMRCRSYMSHLIQFCGSCRRAPFRYTNHSPCESSHVCSFTLGYSGALQSGTPSPFSMDATRYVRSLSIPCHTVQCIRIDRHASRPAEYRTNAVPPHLGYPLDQRTVSTTRASPQLWDAGSGNTLAILQCGCTSYGI
jgi:hypothetical protein